ncbi:glycoside hydrolase family 18 protein [Enterovibrio sp. ZSDZ35]|uniref:chitinase n=1 Tax=Enterovibrio qingdaonensis TaxID=2899818 RepID=A0ABT5QGP8_9GAMM|nr:glycoside hydrolase family 18 protein [Enterovibrio sp. ZSDZ35]MDD1779883.1 glycoside hydrolase family 18 protein [Enterovibrio sp. ZSDZ35]
MKNLLLGLCAIPLLLSGCGGSGSGEPGSFVQPNYNQDSGKVVGTYYTSWTAYEGDYTPADIPGGDLTHIFYAFLSPCGGPKPESEMNASDLRLKRVCEGKEVGEAVFADPYTAFGFIKNNGSNYIGDIAELALLKQQFPHLKIIPSFGGWTLSGPFHDLIKTDAGINKFVESSIQILEDNPVFDGIDIDWEFPGGDGETTPDNDPNLALTPAEKEFEKQQFTVLMQRFRAALDELGSKNNRHYELSAAINGFEHFSQYIDYENVTQYLDFFLVMTYDFFVVGRNDIGHFANLFAVEPFPQSGADIMMNYLMSRGVPSEKLIIGVNNEGRGWEGVPQLGDTGQVDFGPNKATGAMEHAFPTYREIAEKYLTNPGFIYNYDEAAEAPYLYNPTTKQYISYDDPRSVSAKSKYVVDNNLGGLFSWDISSDNYGLLNAANSSIGNSLIGSVE